jgi:hypothetical protein
MKPVCISPTVGVRSSAAGPSPCQNAFSGIGERTAPGDAENDPLHVADADDPLRDVRQVSSRSLFECGINRSDRELEARQLVGDDLPDDWVR